MWNGHQGSSGDSGRNKARLCAFLACIGLALRLGFTAFSCYVQASAPSLDYNFSPLPFFGIGVTSNGFDFVSVDYDLGPTAILGPVPQSQMQTLTSDLALSV